MSDGPIVETTCGRVRGRWDSGVACFLGVPYGADTSGANRFLPPRPVTPWMGIRPALTYGPAAPQAPNTLIDPTIQSIGEDCLRLNVWTPACNDAARPVVVWLHGGGYYAGGPVSSTTNGAALASEHDLVVVSVGHRLGLLGFLDLEDLAEQFAGSGNASMLDLVAALAWVRDNIAGFGGDPSAVTIFGHSGGGAKVITLLTMPAVGQDLRTTLDPSCLSSRKVFTTDFPSRDCRKHDVWHRDVGRRRRPMTVHVRLSNLDRESPRRAGSTALDAPLWRTVTHQRQVPCPGPHCGAGGRLVAVSRPPHPRP